VAANRDRVLSDNVRLINGIIRTIIMTLMIATLVEFCVVSVQAAKTSSTDIAGVQAQIFDTQPSPDPQSLGVAGGH